MLRSRVLVVAVAIAVPLVATIGPASAQDPFDDPVLLGDFDGDEATERVVVREIACLGEDGSTKPPCDPRTTVVRDIQADLVDPCQGGERRTPLLPRSENAIDQFSARELDGDFTRRELIVTGFSGASGRVGSGVAVRLTVGADGCATVRRLFSFGPARARTPKPRGARDFTVGALRALSLRSGPGFPGKELRYSEAWYRRGDPGCCPTWTSSIDLRYDPTSDRYVKYRSTTKRIRAPR